MKRPINYIIKIIACTALSMLSTGLVIFLLSKGREVASGIFFGLFILPSIFIYYMLDYLRKNWKIKIVGYLAPLVCWMIYLIICIAIDMQRDSSEGAGQLATAILISNFVAGVGVYIFMSKVKWFK